MPVSQLLYHVHHSRRAVFPLAFLSPAPTSVEHEPGDPENLYHQVLAPVRVAGCRWPAPIVAGRSKRGPN